MHLCLVEPLDDEEKEVIIKVSGEGIELDTFCYPYKMPHNNQNSVIYAFLTTNIMITTAAEAIAKTDRGRFSYHLVGTVADIHSQKVVVGGIPVILDSPFPGDVVEGSLVSFDVMRLDIEII